MTTDRARIGGGKRGEKENKAPAPKRTVTPGYTPQSGPTLPIPLAPHRVKETGFTPSFFFLFLCSFSWFLFVHADSETPSRRGCDPNYSTERFGALSTWSSSCVSSVEKKKEKSFPASFFFLLVGHLITPQLGRITLDCEVFSVFSVPSSRFLFT